MGARPRLLYWTPHRADAVPGTHCASVGQSLHLQYIHSSALRSGFAAAAARPGGASMAARDRRPGGGALDVESLERENERGVDALAERIGLLKQVTHGIRSEVDSQHHVLDRMVRHCLLLVGRAQTHSTCRPRMAALSARCWIPPCERRMHAMSHTCRPTSALRRAGGQHAGCTRRAGWRARQGARRHG